MQKQRKTVKEDQTIKSSSICWRKAWPPTPVFLLGKSHRQRSLAGCGTGSYKQSDTTEHQT